MQENQLRTFLDAVYGSTGDGCLDRNVLAALVAVVGGDSAAVFEIAVDGGLAFRLAYPGAPVEDAVFSAAFRAHLPDCVFCARPHLVADRYGVTALLDTVDDPAAHGATPGAEEFHRHAASFALIAALGEARRSRLVVTRTDRPFTDTERWRFGLVTPHVDRAYRHVRRGVARNALTRRQQEIVTLLAHGCTDAEIARRLGLSEGTVRKHLNNVYARLGVRNRVAAVARAG